MNAVLDTSSGDTSCCCSSSDAIQRYRLQDLRVARTSLGNQLEGLLRGRTAKSIRTHSSERKIQGRERGRERANLRILLLGVGSDFVGLVSDGGNGGLDGH